jgi:hypothetical protein
MACEDCGKNRSVMIAMEPGRDRVPWELCGRCWMEGRRPMQLGTFKTAQIANPQLYAALVAHSERTTGSINRDKVNDDLGRARGADDPKQSAGDFDRKPRKATRSRRA